MFFAKMEEVFLTKFPMTFCQFAHNRAQKLCICTKFDFREKMSKIPFTKKDFLCYNIRVKFFCPSAVPANAILFPRRFPIMLASLASLTKFVAPKALPSDEIPWSLLITELVIAALLFVLTFLVRQRFLKILCLCGTEVCLFLACKMAFGGEALITEIMRWITAAVACIITISIVNRIHWGDFRGKSGKS